MYRLHPSYSCLDCTQKCSTSSGLTRHHNMSHRPLTPTPDDNSDAEIFSYHRHRHLTGGVALLLSHPITENLL